MAAIAQTTGSGLSRLNEDVTGVVLGFLDPQTLASLETVSTTWRAEVEKRWQPYCVSQGMVLEGTPSVAAYKTIFKDLLPRSLGPELYKRHLGDVGPVPPIPKEFITAAKISDVYDDYVAPWEWVYGRPLKDTCLLTLTPSQITVTIDGTPQILPVTLNNVIMLFQKCRPKILNATPSDFMREVLAQHGDVPVLRPHWTLQREDAVCERENYANQQVYTRRAGFEIVSLIDRVLCELLYLLKKDESLDVYSVRTSTPTSGQQTSVGSHLRFSRRTLLGEHHGVAVAVRVPRPLNPAAKPWKPPNS